MYSQFCGIFSSLCLGGMFWETRLKKIVITGLYSTQIQVLEGLEGSQASCRIGVTDARGLHHLVYGSWIIASMKLLQDS